MKVRLDCKYFISNLFDNLHHIFLIVCFSNPYARPKGGRFKHGASRREPTGQSWHQVTVS